MDNNKANQFTELCNKVKACNSCSCMQGTTKVLSHKNGNLDAKVMFVAEAPGRLGADITGIPLYGDRTGDNFEHLLRYANLSREETFVTNVVLCNPKDSNGNNTNPSDELINSCKKYLEETISIINPAVIVSLGKVAYNILVGNKSSKSIKMKNIVWQVSMIHNRWLIPIYHPSDKVINCHRSMSEQESDYRNIRIFLNNLK